MSRAITTSYHTGTLNPYNSVTYSSTVMWNQAYRNPDSQPQAQVIPPIPSETENHQPINNFRKISL